MATTTLAPKLRKDGTPQKKRGPVPRLKNVRQTHSYVEESMLEWAKHQPGGFAENLRQALTAWRDGTMPPSPLTAEQQAYLAEVLTVLRGLLDGLDAGHDAIFAQLHNWDCTDVSAYLHQVHAVVRSVLDLVIAGMTLDANA